MLEYPQGVPQVCFGFFYERKYMKFYNPFDLALKTDNILLGVASFMSIVFAAVITVALALHLFGVYGLLIFPTVVISRVLYAIFTGK